MVSSNNGEEGSTTVPPTPVTMFWPAFRRTSWRFAALDTRLMPLLVASVRGTRSLISLSVRKFDVWTAVPSWCLNVNNFLTLSNPNVANPDVKRHELPWNCCHSLKFWFQRGFRVGLVTLLMFLTANWTSPLTSHLARTVPLVPVLSVIVSCGCVFQANKQQMLLEKVSLLSDAWPGAFPRTILPDPVVTFRPAPFPSKTLLEICHQNQWKGNSDDRSLPVVREAAAPTPRVTLLMSIAANKGMIFLIWLEAFPFPWLKRTAAWELDGCLFWVCIFPL